jgi:hypothetical protein
VIQIDHRQCEQESRERANRLLMLLLKEQAMRDKDKQQE